ncbi:NUDIX domain-containing protein [Frankia sp. Cppng1_Ct_nod]|uniref:NUDIX hydrolase n=1 Tax=Frankia sp. Cppng1_Ct_nod TaxID=2897162 RepID=UPI0010411ABC|nr:NUDIX domain-containing protein [Frankia sp. Cppng1_Ct_nod]
MTATTATPPRHSVSVAGVVVNENGRVLAIRRRDNGQWQAPGGVLELQETFEQGVRREVLEETGVTVEVDRLTGVYKNLRLGVVALVFRCRPIAGTPQPTAESSEVRWLTESDVQQSMSPAFAVRVTDALAGDAPVAFRAHDGVNLISSQIPT